jgi:hypothetical protein
MPPVTVSAIAVYMLGHSAGRDSNVAAKQVALPQRMKSTPSAGRCRYQLQHNTTITTETTMLRATVKTIVYGHYYYLSGCRNLVKWQPFLSCFIRTHFTDERIFICLSPRSAVKRFVQKP